VKPLCRSILRVALLVVVSRRSNAQDTAVAHRLPPVVTVTRDVGRSPLDLPFAISSVSPDSTRPGQPHIALDQTLLLLPGVTVATRNNPSQDPRISIRGFGARSGFGVRSIRVMRDGMPLTLPDGQTPVDYLDLESVGAVETIRGAASAIYGNASGGVIDVRSASPPLSPFAVQARSWTGSDRLRRNVALFGGTIGDGRAFYQGNVGHTTSDNSREFSHQRLTNGWARVGTTMRGTDLALQALALNMPLAENPGALTRAQLDTAPDMADPLSVQKRARKEVRQLQLGLSAHRAVQGDGEVFAQVFGGTRALYNPLAGFISDVDRSQFGAGMRVSLPMRVATLRNRVSIGVDGQGQNDIRRNWANCNGVATANASCPSVTVEKGVTQLDQREVVSSVGPYLRDEVTIGPASLSAGVRADFVRFELQDHYLADGRDNSGTRNLHAVSPMFGLVTRLSARHAWYVNVASAFETPTTTELGNQPNGNAGLNAELQPQFSTTFETGVKGLALSRLRYDAALFDIEVRDELIPFEVTNVPGRTYYRNAGRTRRRGIELEGTSDFRFVQLGITYAYSNFYFRQFVVGTARYDGNAIPGIPVHQLQASLTVRAKQAYLTNELVAKSRVFANDANSAWAPGFGTLNVRAGVVALLGRPWFSPVVGVQNVFDKRYAGSVAVNASGSALATTKFYEPSPGRTWFVGLTVASGR
jgi:iron complex outermembrane recepter protein